MGELKLNPKYTFKEYLEIDENSELRYEYCNGELFAMAGSTLNHNRISINLCLQIETQLSAKGSPCEPFMSDARVQIFRQNKYYYPDVVVSCEEMSVERQKFLVAPILIAEVLSETTANKDMNDKMLDYFQLPSLQYYLVISQSNVIVHLYERNDVSWGVKLFTQKEEVIHLPKLSISLKVSDLYKKVVWEERAENAAQDLSDEIN